MVDALMRVIRDPCVAVAPESVNSDSTRSESTSQATGEHIGSDTSQDKIFAAGDCCCLHWPQKESPHWFQMRLWSQAR